MFKHKDPRKIFIRRRLQLLCLGNVYWLQKRRIWQEKKFVFLF